MLNIDKTKEPSFFTDVKKNPNIKNYKDLLVRCSKYIRKYILHYEQSLSNRKYCVYCEKIISSHNEEQCHLDHIIPQQMATNKSLDYSNMVVSCNTNGTCGKHKSGKYPNNVINPVDSNPSDYFTFDLMTGELKEKDTSKKIFCESTIEWLNINNYSLKEIRKKIIKILNKYLENNPRVDVKSIITNTIFEQPSLIQSFFKQNSL